MRDVLAMSLDGQLRIRAFKTPGRAVVELACPGGEWVWCVWHGCDTDRAWELFHNQCRFHDGPHPWIAAYELSLKIMELVDMEPTSALREVAHEVLGLPWGEQVGEFVVYGCKRIEAS
jgi:hypothetical protein